MLTISRARWDRGQDDVEIFSGEIQSAVSKFKAFADASEQPREWQMLGDIEGAVYRAEEEIGMLCGHRPDEDTQKTLEDLDDAGRSACRLRFHLEQNDPWRTLAHTEKALVRVREASQKAVPGLPTVEVKLAMDAHRRFQRDA